MTKVKREFGFVYSFVILLALFIFMIVSFAPAMPTAGLDPSWRLAMNVAANRGMTFGHDVIFTYGPLARIETHLYSPGLQTLPTLLETMLAASFAFMIWTIFDGRPVRTTVAVAIVAMYFVPLGTLFLSYGLFYVFSLKALMDRDGPKGDVPAVLLAIPFAIPPLIKGTFLIASFFYIFLAVVFMALRRRPRAAIGAVVAYLALVDKG